MAYQPKQSDIDAWKEGYAALNQAGKASGGTSNYGLGSGPMTTTSYMTPDQIRRYNTMNMQSFPTNLDPNSAEYQQWLMGRSDALKYIATGQSGANQGREDVILQGLRKPGGTGVWGGVTNIPGYQSTAVNPNVGSSLPALTPEMARYYETQLANMRAQERMAMDQQRLSRNQGIADAAAARREALRRAAGSAMDIGAAMAESGVYSPGLQGLAMDTANAQAAQGLAQAAAARSGSFEQYLRNINQILESGRMGRRELDDWRALQLAMLSQNQGQQLAGGSPVFGGM